MLQPRAKITFTRADGAYQEFTVFNNINITKTYEMLTNRCSVVFPKKYQERFKDYFAGLTPIFKRGDKIVIESGYYPNLTKDFEGYITDVNANIPIEVMCEDSMYLLKKRTFNIPATVPLLNTSLAGEYTRTPKVSVTDVKISLTKLLNTIIPTSIKLDSSIIDIDLGKVSFKRMTACEILQRVKERYGLFSYFVDTKLYVGFQSNALTTNEYEYKMERQVLNSNNLFYKIAEDIPIKVVCISISPTNVQTKEEAGDEDGEVRTYHYYNVSTEALKQYAQERLKEARYTGFHGTIVTFLEPKIQHGDRANITSTKIPEMNGVYLCKSVNIDIGVRGGARQIIELGQKV
jgi:hypothetical protein